MAGDLRRNITCNMQHDIQYGRQHDMQPDKRNAVEKELRQRQDLAGGGCRTQKLNYQVYKNMQDA